MSAADTNIILVLRRTASQHCTRTVLWYKRNRMDKTIRKYASLDEMKADEYRYRQSRPVHERMESVSELTRTMYAMKGAAPDVFRLERTLVRVERSWR